MNEELRVLYQQDQADRKEGQLSPDVRERDRIRRKRTKELVEVDVLQTAEDYFHAAMVFQHGESLEDFWQAHELAKKAAQLEHPSGRWLTAAAYDRWLMNQGKPQKYSTQYISIDKGPFTLYEVDPTTTDQERAEWNVPPLAEAIRHTEELSQRRIQSKQDNSKEMNDSGKDI